MKSARSLFMIFFVALLLVSFVSLPVLSGSGDEDPWGADGEEGTTGGSSDSLVVVSSDNVFYSNIGVGADIGTFEDLVFSISFEVVIIYSEVHLIRIYNRQSPIHKSSLKKILD